MHQTYPCMGFQPYCFPVTAHTGCFWLVLAKEAYILSVYRLPCISILGSLHSVHGRIYRGATGQSLYQKDRPMHYPGDTRWSRKYVACGIVSERLVNMEKTVTVCASVLLDQELSMTQHIAKVTSSCFYRLRRCRQIRRPVGQELVAQLVHSFVLSRLDYGNSVLAGIPKSAIMPLQRVQNACSSAADERTRDTSSEAAPLVARRPSTVERTSNCAPWCTQSTPVSVPSILQTWCVPLLSTRWGPVCDPPTPLNTLSRIVALRSASVRFHTPVLSPGTIFHRHSTVSLTRNVFGNN